MPRPKEGEVLVRIDDEDMKVGKKDNAQLFTRRDMVSRVERIFPARMKNFAC